MTSASEQPASSGSGRDTGDFDETGTFVTDEPPRGDVPAHGSSNAGINTTQANRIEGAAEPDDTSEAVEAEGRS